MFPSPPTRDDSLSVTLRFVTSIALFPAYSSSCGSTVQPIARTKFQGAHLEIDAKPPDNLCSGRTIDGYGRTETIEGELFRWQGCDHCGKEDLTIGSSGHPSGFRCVWPWERELGNNWSSELWDVLEGWLTLVRRCREGRGTYTKPTTRCPITKLRSP